MPRLRRAETRSDWSSLLGPSAEACGVRELLSVGRNPYFARAYALFALGGEAGVGQAVIHRDDRWTRAQGRAVGWISLLDGPATPGLVEEIVRWAHEQGLQELRTYRGTAIAEGLGWSGPVSAAAWAAAGFSPEASQGHSDWSMLLTDAPFLESVQAEWERQREKGRWEGLPLQRASVDLSALAESALSPHELQYVLRSMRRLVVGQVSRVFRVRGEPAGAWFALDPAAHRWLPWSRRKERLLVLTFPMREKFSHHHLEAAALAETCRLASSEGWREVVFVAVSEGEAARPLREELISLGCSKGKILPAYRLGVRSTP